MRKPPPLSSEQLRAFEFARGQGGKLYRNASTLWGPESFDPAATSFDNLFGFRTVKTLVTRGRMAWTSPGVASIVGPA
jgi:hypothetical protein